MWFYFITALFTRHVYAMRVSRLQLYVSTVEEDDTPGACSMLA